MLDKSRKKVYQSDNKYTDESNAFLDGGFFTQNFDDLRGRGRRRNLFVRKNAKKKKEVLELKNVFLHTKWQRKPFKSQSNPRIPPTIPFESIVCDYFNFKG